MPSDETAAARNDDFKPELRLHSSSWLFGVVTYLKAFILPLAIGTIVGSDRDFSVWIPAIMIAPMIAAAMWKQWIYRYGFSSNGLVIHEGLLFRNVRTIDYVRIENVDTERNLLHRLFGVADVRVETSTGGSAEARIRVLGLDAVEDMRTKIFAQRGRRTNAAEEQPPAGAPANEELLLALGPGELVRFGLIDNRGLIVVVALLGALGQGNFFDNIGDWAAPMLARLPLEALAGFSLGAQAVIAGATAVLLIAATRLLSIALAFATLFDFRLTRAGDDLRTRYGLLTRVSRTLRQQRIQAVHQTATLLHRLFNRVSIRVDLAGGPAAATETAQQSGRSGARDLWLAPLCAPGDAENLIRIAVPQVRLTGLTWQNLAPRTRGRIFRRLSATWLLAASVPAVWLTGWWAAAILPAALPPIWLHASLYVKHTGWALHEDFFVLRRGWLTRKLAVLRRDRIQSVHLRMSPFDQRYQMARLDLDSAGVTASSHRFMVPYLQRRDAEQLARALYRSPIATEQMLAASLVRC